MNLFENETQKALEEYVSKDWSKILSKYITLERFESIKKMIKNERLRTTVYPDSEDVFKAFKYPYMNIKIVIVGQDPYFNGNADGLAFSCKENLSPSLNQIGLAMGKDLFSTGKPEYTTLQYSHKMPMNLEYLAEQGIFLYNPSLTVEAKSPNSHRYIWKVFNKAVIKSLNERDNLVWMTWGTEAQSAIIDGLSIRKPNHLFLRAQHPASAARNNEVWKCNHFSKANEWLKNRKMEEIKWLL